MALELESRFRRINLGFWPSPIHPCVACQMSVALRFGPSVTTDQVGVVHVLMPGLHVPAHLRADRRQRFFAAGWKRYAAVLHPRARSQPECVPICSTIAVRLPKSA